MRTRALVLVASLASLSLPVGLSAQRMPRTGVRRPPAAEPVPLPPAAEPVARDLALKRSRWSVEGYGMVSTIQVPTSGGIANYTTLGGGTHGDYRYSPAWSGTIDITASALNAPLNVETAEAGVRYSPFNWDEYFRPYVDLRAAFMRMYDYYTPGLGVAQAADQDLRYSRGFGAVGGAGFEYTLTNTLALTTGVSVFRNRMSVYRSSGPDVLPVGSTYWMTSARYVVGFKYNPVTALRSTQNPRQ